MKISPNSGTVLGCVPAPPIRPQGSTVHHQPRSRPVVFAILLAVTAVLAVGGPVGAQSPTSDPYGPTIPPTAPDLDAICVIDDAQVEVGATVTGSIAGAGADADVSIRLAGSEVAQVTTDAAGEGDFSFTVPQLDDGTYDLVAVGVTFTTTCRSVDGAGLEIPGGGAGRPSDDHGGAGAGGGAGSGSDGGALARTGATVLPLALAGLALLLVGAALRRRSRGRVLTT